MSWGVFDSGVGGLTVVRALERALPSTPLVYLGDTARVPYGVRSVDTVRRYAAQAGGFLREAGVDGVIVACNTVSAVALDAFREAFGGPTLGVVEPGVAQALARTRRGRVGVIGTPATIRSDAYGARLRESRPGTSVVSVACPLFVPLAEEGWIEGEVPELVARRYLTPVREAGVDTVVLGCTHYPLLKGVIRTVLGDDVALVDSAEAVAEATLRQGLTGVHGDAPPVHRYCLTDAGGAFTQVVERFLGHRVPFVETVQLERSAPA
jgi:glutamate racemase